MKLGQLLNLVEYISITKKICGVDICGEYPFNPVTSFYKENLKATEKNNKANKKNFKYNRRIKHLNYSK